MFAGFGLRTGLVGVVFLGAGVIGACSATNTNGFQSGPGAGGDGTGTGVGTGGDLGFGGGIITGTGAGTGTDTSGQHVACDDGLKESSTDAVDAAKAMGICQMASGSDWGLISAKYMTGGGQTLPSGAAIGHGILPGFGPTVHPQEGKKLLALSSGAARLPSDNDYQPVSGDDKGYLGGAPTGFPKESPSCPGVVTGDPHDSVALELKLQVPQNAKSFSFNLNFYTYEFPNFICSEFNDFFVAIQSPPPAGLAASKSGNISFDTKGNLISVNAGFLQVCTPNPCAGDSCSNYPCPLGPNQLSGTGFDDFPGNSAATGWLKTTSSVDSGSQVTLRFAVWDSGDGILDSTVLLDNFAFDTQPSETTTTPIVPK